MEGRWRAPDLHRRRHARRRCRRPRARAPDHHEGRRRRADVQQRLPAALHAHRRPGPDRRGRRAADPAPADRRRRARARSSRPTSTGTTTARSPTWSRRPDADVVAGEPDADAITEQTGVDGDPRGSATATPSRSATARSRSSGSPATRRARSACSTATRTATRTCSPATRCSRAASATPSATATPSRSLIDDVEAKLFGAAARRHLVLPRPRQRLDARRRAPAPPGVARARLVTCSTADPAGQASARRPTSSRVVSGVSGWNGPPRTSR